jgi:hypothetical protein
LLGEVQKRRIFVIIEDWAVVEVYDPYMPPETRRKSLNGAVYGHPRFPDGKYVTTSSIVGKNDKNEVVTFSGSSYELGDVRWEYWQKFPNAGNRLLDSLPACDEVRPEQFLVACRDGGEYFLATRTVFTSREEAQQYAATISLAREPIVIEAYRPIPVTLR